MMFRAKMEVSDSASDINPGPGESFWRAGCTLTWPAFIEILAPGPGAFVPKSGGVGLPDDPTFPDDLPLRAGKPFLNNTGAGWRRKSSDTGVLLQQLEVGGTYIHSYFGDGFGYGSALAEVGLPVGYSEIY